MRNLPTHCNDFLLDCKQLLSAILRVSVGVDREYGATSSPANFQKLPFESQPPFNPRLYFLEVEPRELIVGDAGVFMVTAPQPFDDCRYSDL